MHHFFYQFIDPVALHIGPIKIYWYGISYMIGFLLGFKILKYLSKKDGENADYVDSLVFYLVLGVVVGGRLGEVLFYAPYYYFIHPLHIFAVWDGGMSSHGGMIGVLIAIVLFTRRHAKNFWGLTDKIVVATTPGLFFGRIANFINSELVGKISHVPWAVIFSGSGSEPRHPVQIYQALTEGVILFLILWFFPYRKFSVGTRTAIFMVAYGILRFFTEYFRAIDPNYLGMYYNLTTGQILSILMIIVGIFIFMWCKIKKQTTEFRPSVNLRATRGQSL